MSLEAGLSSERERQSQHSVVTPSFAEGAREDRTARPGAGSLAGTSSPEQPRRRGRGEQAEPSPRLLSCSSSSSADRPTGLLAGTPLPTAQCPGGARDAPGCASRGGAGGAHPGAAVPHCSPSRALNKGRGSSSGVARLLWPWLGKAE